MRILITGAFTYTEKQLERLRAAGHEFIFVQDERLPLPVDVSLIDAVLCNDLFTHKNISDFPNLKLIQLTSSGLDRVPVDEIRERGIKLYNAKGVYSIPIAEWVLFRVLEFYKNSKSFHDKQRKHLWEKDRNLLELTNKSALIIGFGDIGTEVAKRMKAFGVYVIGVDIRPIKLDYIDEFAQLKDLDTVISRSDIIVLTLPLTPQTHHLIDKRTIGLMKDNSVLVNVSRGGIVDENELIYSLEKGKFLGVALDVFEKEPLGHISPLWNYDRVTITPHNAFVSDKVNERLFNLFLSNLASFSLNETG